jgi:plasmid stabilization system protein ParE
VNRIVRFTAEASAELEDAVQWYEAKRVGLRLEFIAAVDDAVRAMSRWPNAGARIEGRPMKLPVRRVALFPPAFLPIDSAASSLAGLS